jgi:nitrogen fixation/metabolism regulation signal transduction histidine kinase
MRRALLALLPMLAGILLLIAALWMAADAQSAQTRLGGAYLWLLVGAAAAVAMLVGAVLREAWRLMRQWHRAEPGSRLNARFVLLIGAIAIPPIILVSGFAMRFVDVGIDSWFRADLAQSQSSAEAIGRDVLAAFEQRARSLSNRYAADPLWLTSNDAQSALDAILQRIDEPVHLSLYDESGNVSAIAFNTSAIVFPAAPSEEERLQVRASGQLAINERSNDTTTWRVLEPIAGVGLLQSVFPIPVDLGVRLEALERTAVDYAQLKFQRQAMKSTFMLILGLVGVLALLGALYAALAATRRLIQPITELSVAAGEIAEGRYGRALAVSGSDELGFLTQSFNRMSQELASANLRERASRVEIEQSRARLEAVLERLSAGVISFNARGILTANHAAGELLELDATSIVGLSMSDACRRLPRAAPLLSFLQNCAAEHRAQWREEVRLEGEPTRALLVRGTRLPGDSETLYVTVFDDAALIALSQREAAWAEVAKRLAHEIKNPLTPIQLAAERLRHKYLGKLAPEDSEVLDRATQTIVSQVDALKRIVNAFGDYTRPATEERQIMNLLELIEEVAALYEQSGQCLVRRDYETNLLLLRANKERMRQVLINLFTNAIEASPGGDIVLVDIQIHALAANSTLLTIRDHGQGLPAAFNERWFEPYNTTKPKGTGLGLAWVKRIVEEHGGTVFAENAEGGGARFKITLPVIT